MSALVVDTSSWISYFRGRGAATIEDALDEGRVHVPPVVAAELVSGNLKRTDLEALTSLLHDLPLCPCDLEHWLRVGRLRARLRRRGISISTPDAHVAQCALDVSAALLSEDQVFAHVARHEGLVLA